MDADRLLIERTCIERWAPAASLGLRTILFERNAG